MSAPETICIGEAISDLPTFCANCQLPETQAGSKLLTCARCKLTRYCNRSCQQKHFSLHKRGCKAISRLRQELEEEVGSSEEASSKREANTCIRLGDALFEMTYRFSRTPEAAHDGLASAVTYYMEAIMKDPSSPQAAKISFLLAAMGQDQAAASFMYYNAVNNGEDQSSTVVLESFIPRINLHENFLSLPGATRLDATNLVTLLFIQMKLVVASMDDHGRGDDNDSDGAAHDKATKQMNEIRAAINGRILDALQNCIPLRPAETPTLFDSQCPFEFWCLLQDCFFLTPGVNALLLDDSEEDDDADDNDMEYYENK